eukprot:319766-Rhodomonas_salina.12
MPQLPADQYAVSLSTSNVPAERNNASVHMGMKKIKPSHPDLSHYLTDLSRDYDDIWPDRQASFPARETAHAHDFESAAFKEEIPSQSGLKRLWFSEELWGGVQSDPFEKETTMSPEVPKQVAQDNAPEPEKEKHLQEEASWSSSLVQDAHDREPHARTSSEHKSHSRGIPNADVKSDGSSPGQAREDLLPPGARDPSVHSPTESSSDHLAAMSDAMSTLQSCPKAIMLQASRGLVGKWRVEGVEGWREAPAADTQSGNVKLLLLWD